MGLLALSAAPPPCLAENASRDASSAAVKVGVYDNYPKVFEVAQGRYSGIFLDILSAVAMEQGWKLQHVPGTWDECLKWLESGKIDVMVGVAYSKARTKQFSFSQESTFINWGTVYAREGLAVEGLTDLQGLRVAVMKGSIHTSGGQGIKSILEHFSIAPGRYLEVDSYAKVFELLDTEQADAGVVNRLFGAMNATKYNVQKTSIIFNPNQLHFAFPLSGPRTPKLKTAIDQSLRKMKKDQDSAYYQILDHYLATGTSGLAPKSPPRSEQKIVLTAAERAWIRTHPVVRFAVDPEFVPYEFLGPDGSYGGIASDYVNLLSQRLGVRFELVPGIPWAEVMTKLEQGEIDVLPCVGKTQVRKNSLLFSRPYSQFHRIIITRSDAPFITGLEDITGLDVAVQQGSSHAGFLKENTDITPVAFETLRQALMSVSDGSTDALVGNLAACAYWIRKMNLTNLKIAAPAGREGMNLHFAVRSDWPQLVRIINKGLASIGPEEEQRIMQRWVGVEFKTGIEPMVVRRYIRNATVIALAVLAGILFWNFRLKKEVNRRREAEAKLRYSNKLKNALSKASAKFVNLASRGIDEVLHEALQDIAQVLGCQEAYLYKEVGKDLSCAHYWKQGTKHDDECSFLEPLETHAPWRTREIMAGNVFGVPSVRAMDEAFASSKAYLQERGVESFVEVPLNYESAVVGLLGVASQEDGRDWSPEEIAFLQLTGQIFTNAFMRKNYESALQQYTVEMKQANERLKDLDRLKSMFIASMSHELRTPLNSIIGFTGVLLQGMAGELNPTQTDQLGRVHRASKHLLALITDVIDISKIESGRIDVYAQPFPISEVIKEAIATVEPQLRKKNLELRLKMPEDVHMHTDRKRVLQCLINFLSNAAKYTEQGSVDIDVALHNQQTVEVSVRDTGIGIAEKDMPRLFEAFERFDSHLKVKASGTGLGLYLTRKLVTELLHGEMLVESTLGQGSTFGMRIPVNLEKAKSGTEATA